MASTVLCPGSFGGSCALAFARLALCHRSVVFPWECVVTVILAEFPKVCVDTIAHSRLLIKGGGGSHNPSRLSMTLHNYRHCGYVPPGVWGYHNMQAGTDQSGG